MGGGKILRAILKKSGCLRVKGKAAGDSRINVALRLGYVIGINNIKYAFAHISNAKCRQHIFSMAAH